MKRRIVKVFFSGILIWVAMFRPVAALSPCDFSPEESFLTQLDAQGAFQFYDDPKKDNLNNTFTGNVEANFTWLRDSALIGYRVDGSAQAEFNPGKSFTKIQSTGGFKLFIAGDQFIVGAADLSGTIDLAPEFTTSMIVDVTGGMGLGRFRDVTPLAKAIRLQNTFLDEGVLQGPLTDDKLQEVAQILGFHGLTLAERIERLGKAIEVTGLPAGGNLGPRALLEMEDLISAQGEARLCGWEFQASGGLNLNNLPPTDAHGTLVLNWNYAIVPDPVTQWMASARLDTSLSLFSRYSVRASVSKVQRLSDNLRVRFTYDFSRTPAKDPDIPTFIDRHQFTGTIFFQLTNQLSLSINGELAHETGYEEMSKRLSIQLNYDIF